MSVDYAQVEIDRLIDVARREQNAAWYGPAFYDFTPVSCDRPNQQCLSFRLVYAAATSDEMRTSLEEALTHHAATWTKRPRPRSMATSPAPPSRSKGQGRSRRCERCCGAGRRRTASPTSTSMTGLSPLVRGSGGAGIVRRSRAQAADTSHARWAHLTNISQTGRKCRETRR